MKPEQAASLTEHLAEPRPKLELELWVVISEKGIVCIRFSEAAARNDAWTGEKIVKMIAREAEQI